MILSIGKKNDFGKIFKNRNIGAILTGPVELKRSCGQIQIQIKKNYIVIVIIYIPAHNFIGIWMRL